MRSESHLVSGSLLFLAANLLWQYPLSYGIVFALIIGSLISDVDSPYSITGRIIPLVRIARQYGITIVHHGFFHSVSFILVSAAVLCLPAYHGLIGTGVVLAFLLAIFQHQIMDSTSSIEGIPWLTPLSSKLFRLADSPYLDIPYGSSKERRVTGFLAIICIILALVNYVGPENLLLMYVYNDCKAAAQLFDEWGSRYMLEAEFEAIDLQTNKKVKGTWNLIGHDESTLILEHRGKLYSLSDWWKKNMRGQLVKVKKGTRIKTESVKVHLEKEPLGNLKRYIQENALDHRLFSEVILLEENHQLNPEPGVFNPVQVSGKLMKVQFATLSDLSQFEDWIVDKGNIRVRLTLDPNQELEEGIVSLGPLKVQEITVDSKEEIRVDIGEVVLAGYPLAEVERYVEEMKVERRKLESCQIQLDSLQKQYEEQLAILDRKIDEVIREIEGARKVLLVKKTLLEKGMALKVEVKRAEDNLAGLIGEKEELENKKKEKKRDLEKEIPLLKAESEKVQLDIRELEQKAYPPANYTGLVKEIYLRPKEEGLVVYIKIRELEERNNNSAS